MKDIDKYLEPSEGTWNYPHIDIELLGIAKEGVVPKYRGGCFAVIPYDNNYILLSEDDDNYRDIGLITLQELIELQHIFSDLDADISVKIDFVTPFIKITYLENQTKFLSKNRNTDNFTVLIKRHNNNKSYLITITGKSLNDSMIFDVFWVTDRLKVINNVLKDEKT